jgi:hypothetical protein
MFLTDDELYKLTGYKYSACQIKWLKANGIMHKVNRKGHPVVTRRAVEGETKQQPISHFNLAAVK